MRAFVILCLVLAAAAPAAAGEAWKKQPATKCGSSALFPAAPTESSETFASVDGKVTANLYVATQDEGRVVFLVGCNDYPERKKKPAALLDEARDGAVSSVRGTLVSEKKITVAGHAGREVEIEAPGDNRVFVRLVLVKTRLHQAMIVAPRGQVAAEDVKKFLGSFKPPRTK